MTMGHMQTAFEVLLSLGNDPGDNFNITLMPTFGAKGLGSLCLPQVSFDEKNPGWYQHYRWHERYRASAEQW